VPLDAEDTVLLFGMIYEQLLPLLVETPFLIHSQLMPFLAGLVPSSPELIALFSRSLLQSASVRMNNTIDACERLLLILDGGDDDNDDDVYRNTSLTSLCKSCCAVLVTES